MITSKEAREWLEYYLKFPLSDVNYDGWDGNKIHEIPMNVLVKAYKEALSYLN